MTYRELFEVVGTVDTGLNTWATNKWPD